MKYLTLTLTAGSNFAGNVVTAFTKDNGQALSDLIFREQSKEIIFVRGGAPNRNGEIPNPTSDPNCIIDSWRR